MPTIETSSSVTQDTTPGVLIPAAIAAMPAVADSTGDGVSQELFASKVLPTFLLRYKAIGPDELVQINIEIPTAVMLVLGALREIRQYRAQVVQAMPSFDITHFDELEGSAVALHDAHGNYLVAVEASTELQTLLVEATKMRETLFTDATSLAYRGLVDAQRLEELKGPVGHRNLATDINVLWKALRASWPQIVGKCPTTEAELARAEQLQLHLMRLLGEKDKGEPSVAAVTDTRQRAFTYFVRCYDQVRRAIHFLRWQHGDADSIAPSLYAGRGGKRKAAAAANGGAANGSTALNGSGVVAGVATGGSSAPAPGTAGTGGAILTPSTNGHSNLAGAASAANHAETDPFLA